ncbi:MAG: hypothetical protein H7X88_06275 [Gloeobacteraceae cyanobacterium ES-bin-316]|nr:hypothetical protein [Ferruginibacter sp.]
MKLEFLITATYILICFWLIPQLSFVKNAGLGRLKVRLCFAFKMSVAIAAAYYFTHSPLYNDYVGYNSDGMAQYELLTTDPAVFFTDFTRDLSTYGLGGMLDSSYSFWAYLRFNLVFKFIGLMNLLTHGNFYLNCLVFSSFTFFAQLAFYRIYANLYPEHKLKMLLICFLVPSILIYTACPHKDGLVFLGIAAISFIFYRYLKFGLSGLKAVVVLILALCCIFLLRNYVLIALLPTLFTAWLCRVLPFSRALIFVGSYFLYAAIFFLSGQLSSSLSLPQAVIKRKSDFQMLPPGSTNLSMNELYPSVQSFAGNIPQAINHSLLRPYFWELRSTAARLTALELAAFQLILVAFIFFRKRNTGRPSIYNLYSIAFFLSMALIIGYTIPNVGAIVRYRSLLWIFVLCPMVASTNWEGMKLWRKAGGL